MFKSFDQEILNELILTIKLEGKGKQQPKWHWWQQEKFEVFFFWFLLYLVGILCVTQHSIDNILVTYIANINIASFQKVPL
jgi:hypothetical protein